MYTYYDSNHEAEEKLKPDEDEREYREFNDAEEAEAWAQKHYAGLLELPPEDEMRKAIFFYTGSCYKPYNELLRVCPPIGSNEFKKINFGDRMDEVTEIQMINEALCKFALPESIVVYRFTHNRIIRRLCGSIFIRKGMEFSDKAFFSTTLVRSLLKDFGKEHLCSCMLKLYLPKGLPGAYVSFKDERSCLNEQEFLLPPSIRFRILKIHYFRYPRVIECLAVPD